jgi:Leucine-rich repeat (LRR) protein
MFTYLVQDDSVPRRRSDRLKTATVKRFQASLATCPASVNLAAELKYWNDVQAGSPLPKVSIKELPRRSARGHSPLTPRYSGCSE